MPISAQAAAQALPVVAISPASGALVDRACTIVTAKVVKGSPSASPRSRWLVMSPAIAMAIQGPTKATNSATTSSRRGVPASFGARPRPSGEADHEPEEGHAVAVEGEQGVAIGG